MVKISKFAQITLGFITQYVGCVP